MKITRLLPKKLAKGWQEYDLNRTRNQLEYHRAMVRVLEEMEIEGSEELHRLKGDDKNNVNR